MPWMILIFAITLLVAYANGANDNFKGAATLLGSGTSSYRKALAWATATTFAGSLGAIFLAGRLVRAFGGGGLVPEAFTSSPLFLAPVALGAGLTVLLTALAGIPISTTHALVGGLVGAGLVAVGGNLGFGALGAKFFLPLAVGPILALCLTAVLYPLLSGLRKRLGVSKSTCVCIGDRAVHAPGLAMVGGAVSGTTRLTSINLLVEEKATCEAVAEEAYEGRFFGLSAQRILDALHFLSAGAVSFARGLNDTPKIVALAVGAGALGLSWNFGLVALAMAAGGLLGARRVAVTMSRRITAMNPGQGFTANLVTAATVILSSVFGLPASTTHVSCGSLFGIGLATGGARWKTVGGIVSAWFLTLPVSAALSAACYLLLQQAAP